MNQHEQEARVLLGVGTHEPCDCITFDERFWSQRCYCQNSGDLERAQDWVTSANLVEPIAEALRKRDAEIDQLREQVTQLLADNQVIIQCQEDDKAEIAKLREERDYFQRRYEEARCKSPLKD